MEMGMQSHSMERMRSSRERGDQRESPATSKPQEADLQPSVAEKPRANGQQLSKNELSKLRNRSEFVEKEIQRIEGLIELNSNQLNDPQLAKDFVQFKQLSDRHEDLNARLKQLYGEWETTVRLLEQ